MQWSCSPLIARRRISGWQAMAARRRRARPGREPDRRGHDPATAGADEPARPGGVGDRAAGPGGPASEGRSAAAPAAPVAPIVMPAVVAAPMGMAAPAAAAAPAPTPVEKLPAITSPMVGTYYAASSPDAEPYVKVGDHVSEDTVVCIIEAMKVFNEIRAEMSGTVEQDTRSR